MFFHSAFMLFILLFLRPRLRPFLLWDISEGSSLYRLVFPLSLPFPFVTSAEHVIIVCLLHSRHGHSEYEEEQKTHSKPSNHYTKEGKITMFRSIIKRQHWVRKVNDEEICYLYYTWVFEIHLHLSTINTCTCACTHIHTVSYTQPHVLITALFFFLSIIEWLYFGGYLYNGILYTNEKEFTLVHNTWIYKNI